MALVASFTPTSNSIFHRWEYLGSERGRHLFKVTQPVVELNPTPNPRY